MEVGQRKAGNRAQMMIARLINPGNGCPRASDTGHPGSTEKLDSVTNK